MTRRLFFYGGRAGNFAQTSTPFIAAAGGRGARVALLFASGDPGWDRNLDWYRQPWIDLGATVIPVHPEPGSTRLSHQALETLRTCTGIFMSGGETRRYHEVYIQSGAADLIRGAYRSGVPYGGLSAGALLAPATGQIWGDRLTTATNLLRLRGSEEGCDSELETGPCLGLLDGWLVEAHFTERGGFGRLVAAMEQTGIARGIGLDNPICMQIENETSVEVSGEGRAYRLCRQPSGETLVAVYNPGESFSVA